MAMLTGASILGGGGISCRLDTLDFKNYLFGAFENTCFFVFYLEKTKNKQNFP